MLGGIVRRRGMDKAKPPQAKVESLFTVATDHAPSISCVDFDDSVAILGEDACLSRAELENRGMSTQMRAALGSGFSTSSFMVLPHLLQTRLVSM